MLNKRIGAAVLTAMMLTVSACGSNGASSTTEDGKPVLKMAALEGGYGKEIYSEVIAEFEKQQDVKVELTISKSIEDEITPNMKAGKYPDVVVLGQGRSSGLTETLIKDKGLEDLTGVLAAKVPGEEVTVQDKLVDGLIGTLGTNPYGNESTYLMPMFYSPTGLVYNKGLFEQKGWEVPTTWDEMFALGETAKQEGIALFTYPTAGYLDSFFFALLADVGGQEFYDKVMNYEQDIWQSAEATQVLEITTKLLSYSSDTTVAYANEQDFTKNQQSILDNTTLFMPNGTWIAGEMGDAPKAEGFAWGLMPIPTLNEGDDRYIVTSMESVWVPSESKNKELAKEFVAFLYSDKAAAIFAKSNAVQPIKGIAEQLTGENQSFYSVYDAPQVKALVGGFVSTKPVEGVNIKAVLFDTANSIISKQKTAEDWQKDLNQASEKMRAAKE
ncbi:carbohydrate ABC transporter substrate-binding protein [Paenibacillus donghaensis]|uniref:Carbohydrate ABC transporter substrate-binding protein n=1 Tax=Paenibacillus donghaensis TaxID=414771 RepID=A0A2Z2KA75_9BACL|nr:carbohydrate ABC transporter substrate-binding protein [Paenibacillus donghaensis]ASA20425.1 carbohydrate ABC transporter substrate-binding protein [Paenibacillus donghaensis]